MNKKKQPMETFHGYRRTRGLPGTRNVVAIIPSVFCANTVARRIAEQVAGTIAFCHPVGCSQVGLDKEEFPLSELSLGLKCGGTDAASGIAANPALGSATDQVVGGGGRAIFTEVTELIGAEHLLAGKATTPHVAGAILKTI